MYGSDLIRTLSQYVPVDLATALVNDFVVLRQNVSTGTLGHSAPGRFVETFVQILQFLESGTYEAQPNVEAYLRNVESRASNLDDGLRICGARIARAMYAVRSKRNIVHRGQIDANVYDLRFLHFAAQWLTTELIRVLTVGSMTDAGKLIEQVQLPVETLVEDIGGRKLVLRNLTVRAETLVVFHSRHPEVLSVNEILSSLDRRNARTVRSTLKSLWADKCLEGSDQAGYRLTARGLAEASAVIVRCA